MSAADLKAKQGERERETHREGKQEARILVSSSMCRFWLARLLSGERRGWEEREGGRKG